MKKSVIISMLALLLLSGCNASKKIDSTYAYNDFEVKCVATDGEYELLRSWGKGNDKKSSLVQARKNALRAVMFKGITGGVGGCRMHPIVTAVNAEENNREYFNNFFSENGQWSKFVKIDEKRGSRKLSRNKEIENWEVTVAVDLNQLINHLRKDNIIE